MTRIARRLLCQVAAALAASVGGVWLVGIAGGLVGALAAGAAPLAGGLDSVREFAALALPVAIQVGAPLGVGGLLFVLAERGELETLAAIGIAPWRVVLAVSAPVVLLVIPLVEAVAVARPAAEARLRDRTSARLATHPEDALARLDRGEIGAARRSDGGWNVLAAVGSGAIGLGFARFDGLAVEDGRVETVGFGADTTGRFARVELQPLATQRGLGQRVESELSTRFLASRGAAWGRQRIVLSPADTRALLRAELRERAAVPWALLLGLSLALAPLVRAPRRGWRRIVHGATTVAGMGVAALGPRLVG